MTKVAYVNNQVAVYQGSEDIDEEPEVMLHMIYITFTNFIRTVLFIRRWIFMQSYNPQDGRVPGAQGQAGCAVHGGGRA